MANLLFNLITKILCTRLMVDVKKKTDGNIIVSIDGDSSNWVNEKMKT